MNHSSRSTDTGPILAWFLFYTYAVHSPRDILLRTPVSKGAAGGKAAMSADSIVAKLQQQEFEIIQECMRARPCCGGGAHAHGHGHH